MLESGVPGFGFEPGNLERRTRNPNSELQSGTRNPEARNLNPDPGTPFPLFFFFFFALGTSNPEPGTDDGPSDQRPPVRIGIDARKLHDFGIGTYIRNLLRQLARLDHDTEYVLLCRAEDCALVAALGENFRAVAETARTYSLASSCGSRSRCGAKASTCSTRRITCCRRSCRCRSVVTIHDCIHLMFPQYLPNRLALRLRARVDVAGGAPRRRAC